MKIVHQKKDVYEKISEFKQSSKNCVTNFYPNNENLNYWIKEKKFFFVELLGTIFFFRKDRDFFHLYFYSINLLKLQEDLKLINSQSSETFVIDCIGSGVQLETLVKTIEQCGFNKYILYNRMKKFISDNEVLSQVSQEVVYPDFNDVEQIFELFESNFDRFAEQLPTIDELKIAINSREVLVIKDNSTIVGVIIRKITAKNCLWMFFLVRGDYRNNKVGSKLLSYFFNECRNKRVIMWVLANNLNAIKIYRHYGFTIDSLNDQILINKDIYYETKSN